jgi:GNAT superfamily N-acetyltransferase
MGNEYATRLANENEKEKIIDLSLRVQEALSASGSLQQIGPLEHEVVATAIREGRCFVLAQPTSGMAGCVFLRHIEDNFYPGSEFDISSLPQPRLFLHWMMLAPEIQCRGLGSDFFRNVIYKLKGQAACVLLDCWAGNEKLRDFYTRAGCELVATIPENDYEIAIFAHMLKPEIPEATKDNV